MVRLVLFDIDGTLVHTGGAGTAAFTRTFAKHFNLHHGTEKMRFAGRTDVSLVREFFRIHGLPETPENFSFFFENYVFWLEIVKPTFSYVWLWHAIIDSINNDNSFIHFCFCCVCISLALKSAYSIEQQYRKTRLKMRSNPNAAIVFLLLAVVVWLLLAD